MASSSSSSSLNLGNNPGCLFGNWLKSLQIIRVDEKRRHPTKYPKFAKASLLSVERQRELLSESIPAGILLAKQWLEKNSESPRKYVNKKELYAGVDAPNKEFSLDFDEKGQPILILKAAKPARGTSQKVYPAIFVHDETPLSEKTMLAWIKTKERKVINRRTREVVIDRTRIKMLKQLQDNNILMLSKFREEKGFLQLIHTSSYINKFYVERPVLIAPYYQNNLLGLIQTRGWARSKKAKLKVHILKGLVGLLAEMEKKGIQHRDIKAENVLLDAENNPLIIDFEYSREIGPEPTSCLSFSGSSHYVSPEYVLGYYYFQEKNSETPEKQALNKKMHLVNVTSTKCDSWSMGVLIWMLFTATFPFIGDPKEHSSYPYYHIFSKEGDADRLLAIRFSAYGGISNPVINLIANLLQEDPDKRWGGSKAAEFLAGITVKELEKSVLEIADCFSFRFL